MRSDLLRLYDGYFIRDGRSQNRRARYPRLPGFKGVCVLHELPGTGRIQR